MTGNDRHEGRPTGGGRAASGEPNDDPCRWRPGARYPTACRSARWSTGSTWSSSARRQHSVLYGRCLHRGALLSDGRVDGDNLICGLHGWDYRIDTGVSEYNNDEVLREIRQPGSTAARSWSTPTRSRPGSRTIRSPSSATRTSASTPTRTGRRGRAACPADPAASDQRAQQDRPPRRGRGHGRAAAGPAVLGRHPVRDRAACDRRPRSTTCRSAPRS